MLKICARCFVATSKDIRVILIKLADRIHNMRTIQYVKRKTKELQKKLLKFCPIANRLGIGEWKDELEDTAFEIANPEAFKKTKEVLEAALLEDSLP